MAFLQKAGVKNIQQRAAAMRNSIKKQAADGADSVDVTYNKPKTVKKTTQKVTQKEKVQAAGAKSDPRPKVDAGKVPNFMKKTVSLLKMVKDNPEAAVSNVLQQLDKMSYRMIEISEVKSMVNEANMVAQHTDEGTHERLLRSGLTRYSKLDFI
jgi:D-arabinose 1-dehydrogenase-like Zn-dependent alcohol dehydrogenase